MDRMMHSRVSSWCRSRLGSALLAVLLALAAALAPGSGECSEQPGSSAVQAEGPDAVVDMVVREYAFDPTLITAQAGSRLTIRVRSEAPTVIRLVILNPDGQPIADNEVPGNGNAEVTIHLEDIGVYEFYNGSPMEASLGMRGRIVVR